MSEKGDAPQMSGRSQMRAVVATPLTEELCQLIEALEPRLELVRELDLIPPARYPSDHSGDPSFRRTAAQEARFVELVNSADVLYGVPYLPSLPGGLARVVAENPKLHWVQLMAAGGGAMVRYADLDPAELDRVAFTTAAGVHAVPLSEFALLGLLAGFKELEQLQADQTAHHWPPQQRLLGQLSGSTVLVVGLGGIGTQLAGVLSALGVRVIGTARTPGRTVAGVAEVIHPDQINEVAGRVDGVVATLPGTETTYHLLGREFFDAVKPGVTLVNVGRGSVIDEAALIGALQRRQVGFAALDVVEREPLAPYSPLWDLPNVLISPHTASNDAGEDRRIAELFADNATRLLDGRELRNRVDTVEFY